MIIVGFLMACQLTRILHVKRFFFLSVLIALSGVAYALISSVPTVQKFVTWDSLEPDKWSTIWLIKKHINPNAVIEILPTGSELSDGIAFGVPQAQYKRSSDSSTFENILLAFDKNDPVLREFGKIITEIETTSWSTANDPIVHIVEQNFRRLQDRYGRAYVPVSCYAHFFDVLYDNLASASFPRKLDQSLMLAVNSQSCSESPQIAERMRSNRVTELPIQQLLSEIALNKKVVFVDTREPLEFKKSHIPGAINIPMRNLDSDIYRQLAKADRVISYCVKDFRGYEVAKRMLDNGVNSVAVMKPHGLSGWQSLGLPLTDSTFSSEETTKEQLYRCARDQQLCLTKVL